MSAEVRNRSLKGSVISVNSMAGSDVTAVGMRKTLGLVGGISYIIGVMIGSGIFVSPKGVLEGAGSVGFSLILWLAGGILSLFGALAYAELGTMIPKSGGEYAYLLDSLHPVFAFLFSWSSAWILKPSGVAVISLTCAEYVLVPLFNDGCGSPPSVQTKLLAITVILVLSAVNIMSVETANKVQIFFTLAKLLALAIIILGGIVKLCQGYTEHLATGFEGTNSNVGEIAIGFYSSMWAYDGWNNLNYVTEELIQPSKNLPRAIWIGIPLVTVLYLLTNISYFTVLSPEDLLNSPAVAVTWAERVIPNISWIIPIFVAMSTFGAANGVMFSTSRLLYVAGREGHMVKSLSMIHVTRNTPSPSIIFTVAISIIMVIPSNIGSLINFFSFAAWMFYGLVFGCHVYLRFKRPDALRPYRCPVALSIIACLVSIFIVLAPVIQAPQIEFLYAFLFIVGGVFFYFPFVHFKLEIPKLDKFNAYLQVFMQVSPPDEKLIQEMLEVMGTDEEQYDGKDIEMTANGVDQSASRPQSRVSNQVAPLPNVDT